MKVFFIVFIVVTGLMAREVSSFGAGALDSDNPYGMSESEKVIFANKKKIRYQNQRISELAEQVEGMRSVVASVSQKIGKTGERINEINQQSSQLGDNEIRAIKEDISELKKVQTENYEKINGVLKKLSAMIDKINSNYATLDDVAGVVSKKKEIRKKKESKSSTSKNSNLNNSEKLKNAVALFRKEFYTKSFPIFEELAKVSYKPATTNYYLGEISYYKKHYKDAIVYYKKSVGYYDKASYMPTLLLHTGFCFEQLKDDENKEKFLNALLSSYPNSQEAEMAQTHLN